MRVTIIRHGQPDEVGTDDPPLTNLGRQQALAAQKAIAAASFDLVVSSPALRARQTAEPHLATSGHTLHLEDALAEIDYGDSEYVRVEDARARGDETWDLWKARLRATVDQPVEAAFLAGITETFARLAATHDGKEILVFAHGGVINGLTALATRSSRLWLMLPDYCGISRFEIRNGNYVIKTLNEIAHLEDETQLTAEDLVGG